MKKIKIMAVDDNEDVLFTIKEGLMSISNYEIQTINSGEKCIETLKSQILPDLILLDIMMPRMDGWEVASRLKQKKEWKNIPLIFLTAKTDDLSRGLGSLSSDDYIGKPFEIMNLKERIDRVLNKYYKV